MLLINQKAIFQLTFLSAWLLLIPKKNVKCLESTLQIETSITNTLNSTQQNVSSYFKPSKVEKVIMPEPNQGPEPIQIQFTLGARGLPSMDGQGDDPDPYAVVEGVFGNSRTSVIGETYDPDWKEVFSVLYKPEQQQTLRIRIYDQDDSKSEDIGYALITVSEILKACKEYYYDITLTNAKLIVKRAGCEPDYTDRSGGVVYKSSTEAFALVILVYLTAKAQ